MKVSRIVFDGCDLTPEAVPHIVRITNAVGYKSYMFYKLSPEAQKELAAIKTNLGNSTTVPSFAFHKAKYSNDYFSEDGDAIYIESESSSDSY